MEKNKAKRILIGLFKRRGRDISFMDMDQELARNGIEPKGQFCLCPSGYPHLIIWLGMSRVFMEAVKECLAEGIITLKLTTPLVYVIDGSVPNLPVAKGVRSKKDSWVPSVASYRGIAANSKQV